MTLTREQIDAARKLALKFEDVESECTTIERATEIQQFTAEDIECYLCYWFVGLVDSFDTLDLDVIRLAARIARGWLDNFNLVAYVAKNGEDAADDDCGCTCEHCEHCGHSEHRAD